MPAGGPPWARLSRRKRHRAILEDKGSERRLEEGTVVVPHRGTLGAQAATPKANADYLR